MASSQSAIGDDDALPVVKVDELRQLRLTAPADATAGEKTTQILGVNMQNVATTGA